MMNETLKAPKLIGTDSDLYGKRLVREIHSTLMNGVGVYWTASKFDSNPRVISASYSPKWRAIVIRTNRGVCMVYNDWDSAFCDGYGRDICATRRAR